MARPLTVRTLPANDVALPPKDDMEAPDALIVLSDMLGLDEVKSQCPVEDEYISPVVVNRVPLPAATFAARRFVIWVRAAELV